MANSDEFDYSHLPGGFSDPPGADKPAGTFSYREAVTEIRRRRRAAARRMRDEGASLREIGRALGVDHVTVRNDLAADEQQHSAELADAMSTGPFGPTRAQSDPAPRPAAQTRDGDLLDAILRGRSTGPNSSFL